MWSATVIFYFTVHYWCHEVHTMISWWNPYSLRSTALPILPDSTASIKYSWNSWVRGVCVCSGLSRSLWSARHLQAYNQRCVPLWDFSLTILTCNTTQSTPHKDMSAQGSQQCKLRIRKQLYGSDHPDTEGLIALTLMCPSYSSMSWRYEIWMYEISVA